MKCLKQGVFFFFFAPPEFDDLVSWFECYKMTLLLLMCQLLFLMVFACLFFYIYLHTYISLSLPIFICLFLSLASEKARASFPAAAGSSSSIDDVILVQRRPMNSAQSRITHTQQPTEQIMRRPCWLLSALRVRLEEKKREEKERTK